MFHKISENDKILNKLNFNLNTESFSTNLQEIIALE